MSYVHPSREAIKELLQASTTIAVVGLSDKPDRTSYMVSQAMQAKGYRIVPVNPQADRILGETCYPSLSDIPFAVDIVNVFRRAEHCPPVVEEAVKLKPRAIWLQLGIISEESAAIAEQAGIPFLMDRCIKVEDSILLPDGKSAQ